MRSLHEQEQRHGRIGGMLMLWNTSGAIMDDWFLFCYDLRLANIAGLVALIIYVDVRHYVMCYMFSGPSVHCRLLSSLFFPHISRYLLGYVCEVWSCVCLVSVTMPTYLRMREMNQLRFVPWTSRERRGDWVCILYVEETWKMQCPKRWRDIRRFSQGQVSSLCAVWSTEAHDSTQATWRVKATIGVQNSAIFHCPTVIVPEKNGKTIRLHSPSFASMPWSVYLLSQDQLNGHLQRSLGNFFGNLPAHHVCRVTYAYVCCCWRSLDVTAHLAVLWYRLYIYILLDNMIAIWLPHKLMKPLWPSSLGEQTSRTVILPAVRLLPRIAVGLGVPLERASFRLGEILGLFEGQLYKWFKNLLQTNDTLVGIPNVPLGGHQSPSSVPWFLALAKMTRPPLCWISNISKN